ncbi:MAG: hypothetical protein OHK006_09910 [Thermodesulfovibrionales bacterium]
MKKRRIAILAVSLVVALFVFERYFLAPETEEIRATIERESATLEKYQRVLRSAPPGESEMTKIEARVKTLEKRLVPDASEQLASATIQSHVVELARKSGFSISTIKPGTPITRDSYRQIPVYFEGNGNIKQISDFLKAVDQGQILLSVDRLGINITNMQNPKELKVKVQISGMMKP